MSEQTTPSPLTHHESASNDWRPVPNEPDVDSLVGGQLRAEFIRHRLLCPQEVDGLRDPGWLIEDYVPAGGLSTVYGRPGSYKTFLALDWSCHVATGSWWDKRRVAAGPVIYVMAEGVGGLPKRKQAWEKAHNTYLAEFPIRWYPQPVNLLDPEWSEGLAIVAAEHQTALVVIDTTARAMPGGDENASKDMGRLIASADRIRAATGGAVMLVHHTPLDGGRLRGHSSLEGAVDTNIGVEFDGTTVKLTVDKQKDAEPPAPMLLHPEHAGESIVLRPGAGAPGDIPPQVLAVLGALDDADLGEGITSTTWEKSLPTSLPTRTFHRTIKNLFEQHYCHMVQGERGSKGARYGITDQGREVLHA